MPNRFLKNFAVILLSLSLANFAWAGISFDGVDDYVDIGTMGSFGTGLDTSYFILSCWFKTSITDTKMVLFGTANDSPNTVIFVRLNDNSGVTDAHDIRLYRRDEESLVRSGHVIKAGGVCDGNWHNIGVGLAAGALFCNLDGVSQTITAETSQFADNMANFQYPMVIGAYNGGGTISNYFNGEITDVAIWTEGAGATIPSSIFNSRLKYLVINGIITVNGGYWPMDEGTHGNSADLDTAWDMSGNGNNGNPDNGANNTGLSWAGETILSYPPHIIGAR